MAQFKGTEGEFNAGYDASITSLVIKNDYGNIAKLYYTGNSDITLANAKLFAASKELLSACETATKVLESKIDYLHHDEQQLLTLLRAAIAKATE